MKTTFRMKQPYFDILMQVVKDYKIKSARRPERFKMLMNNNKGLISELSGRGLDEQGLELRNPIIVALGDSVTAGHFESLVPMDSMDFFDKYEAHLKKLKENLNQKIEPLEITDARECYLEKFRMLLIDKYEQTSVSTINAGIAGDNLKSMFERTTRDVIQHQPDLVIINGALNWSKELGDANEYKNILISLVRKIKMDTEADIILLTPNGDLPNSVFQNTGTIETDTMERVMKIREVADIENVCLCDVYEVWEKARDAGCPWNEILANGTSHPSVEGHLVYAHMLMKLFD